MLRSMSIGISGMKANGNALSVTANNIANDQTIGYKQQQAIFEELFYQSFGAASAPNQQTGGTNSMEIGNGVKLGAITSIHTQGTIVPTGNKTDMAIQGEGFFVLGDASGGNREYTRAGNFTVNEKNQIVSTTGGYVMGWNIDPLTGVINTGSDLGPITIQIGSTSTPKQSSAMTIKGNLNTAAETGDIYSMQVPTYDSLGTRHDVSMDFIKTGGNTYRYVATPKDGFVASANIAQAVLKPSSAIADDLDKGSYTITSTVNAAGDEVNFSITRPDGVTMTIPSPSNNVDGTITLSDGTNNWFTIDYKATAASSTSSASFTVGEAGDMTFNATGQLQTVTNGTGGSVPTINYISPNTGNPVSVQLDMNSFTGISADSILKMTSTDGTGAAVLTDYTVSDGGIVQGYYSDGSVKDIGMVAVATFSNPAGLSRVGSGNYQVTGNSGSPDIGVSSTGTRGLIKAQSAESSNVDLATEFVNMMTTQKAYQANTKIIQTSNDILDSVINLIR